MKDYVHYIPMDVMDHLKAFDGLRSCSGSDFNAKFQSRFQAMCLKVTLQLIIFRFYQIFDQQRFLIKD